MKVLISGGGTGGHIYPALAIANAIKELVPEAEFLFVGAEDRMEMQKVPQAGYDIIGLPIAGLQRGLNVNSIIKNLSFPFKLFKSLWKARAIVKGFKPDVAVGVGGYASGPMLWAATSAGVPALIQEQNSYAGLTNKLLAKRAKKICVAYDGMDKYFPSEKLVYTGNPVRKEIINASLLKLPGLFEFKFAADRKTILVIGGSLGARTINESIAAGLDKIRQAGYQLIWQTGKSYFTTAEKLAAPGPRSNGWGDAKVYEFVTRMDLAYGVADVVISRAGALSITELCTAEKPCILVPSPNVAEDHQTKNAEALTKINAALMVKDIDAKETLVDTVLALLANEEKQTELRTNIATLSKPNAAEVIAKEVISLQLSV
jgi:UDP-N-acetylglucosamine--N-acetylmuramyl-(pentapeptide) pyrophosphoryl-undecaprenol N-acetylglucosamine transferase